MRFMVLVKASEQSEAGVLPDEKMLSEMGAYNAELIKAGVMIGGDGLQASSMGTRVRITGNKTRLIDGPFAEAKELVAGYWLLQAKSKQEAIDWLQRAPFQEGEVEIRPLFEPEDFPVDPAEQPDGWRDKERELREATGQPFQTITPRKPGTKRFIALLKADRGTETGALPSEQLLTEMGGLMEEMTKAGVMLSGEGLKPSAEGVRIAYSGNERRVIEGPFSSKELLAGYALIQTKTKDEAVEWARRCIDIHVRGTGVEQGEIEVRQLFELEDFPVDAGEKPGGWRDQEQAIRDRSAH